MNLRSLRVLLPAAAMTAMLAVVGATSLIHYGILDRTISANTASSLVARQANLIDRIQTTFDDLAEDVSVRAASGEPSQAIAQLSALLADAGPDGGETIRASLTAAASDGTPYRAAYDGLMDYYKAAQAEHGYYDVFLIGLNGDVLLTVAKERDLLGNVLEGELAGTGLARAYQAALKAPPGQSVFADYAAYPPSKDALAAFLAATVAGPDGKPVGVYAVQLPNFALPAPPAGGDTIDVTVAGPDNQLRLSLDTTGAQPLALGADLPESAPLSAALRGESGVILDQTDQSGKPVALAYAPIHLMDTVWGITTMVPRVSMLALLRDNIVPVSVSMLLLLGVMGGISLIAARWVGQPLVRLAHTVAELAAGREPEPIPDATRHDEVGLIAREIDSFRLIQTERTTEAMQNLFLGTAFQQAGAAMMILDQDGTLRFANAAMSDLVAAHATTMRKLWPDLNPDHLVGTAFPTALIPPVPQMGARSSADIDFGGTAMSITVSPIADAEGRTLGLLLMWEDVVEQRKARAIVGAIQQNQVMIELDPDARVISANHHACMLYRYSAEEFVGLNLRVLMRDDGAALPRIMAELRQNGCVAERHLRRNKLGEDVWVDCTFNAIFDDQHRILRIVVVCVDVTDQVQRTEAAEAAARSVQAAQGRVVDALGTALGRLASGDLTATLNDPFGADYEALRNNYNAAVQKLHDALDGVVDGARNIRNGASEIAEAADDLSRRTESQAATLEETAAALDLLTANVKSAAAGADEADRTVAEARAQAETSGGVVIEAVSAMSEIEQSSRQIRQIIGVIDDIAFQTNLLALNAGVEAARAGDAGRGFAVVASEVRALAQRSSEAAKEIKELISASSRHVEKGVGLVGQTGEALKSIVEGVSAIATRVSAIAQSSREQSTGLSEINSGVSNMDQVTQQNAAMVEQSTAASHSLRSEAEQLASLVAHFNLRQRGGTDRAKPRAAAAQPQPAVPQPQARPAPRSRAAVAAPAAAPATAGWEEF